MNIQLKKSTSPPLNDLTDDFKLKIYKSTDNELVEIN